MLVEHEEVKQESNDQILNSQTNQISIVSAQRLDLQANASEVKWAEMVRGQNSEQLNGDNFEENKNSENPEFYKRKNTKIECHGVSDAFRIIVQVDQGVQQASPFYLFSKLVDKIRLYVHPLFKMPSSSSLMPILNLCNKFQNEKRMSEYLELDILAAQSLIAARKFIQAIEKLRKIQSNLIQ